MACKQNRGAVVVVDGFKNTERPETQEKRSDAPDTFTQHVENVVRTWDSVKTNLEGNGIVFYLR